jgi:hypothetical protein
MSHKRPFFGASDFGRLPSYPGPPADDRPERPAAPGREVAALAGVRRKPGLFVRSLPGLLPALLLPSLLIVSWSLAGNALWGWSAAAGAILLIILTLAGFRALDELRARHFLLYGSLVLCWVGWVVVGFCWPITEVRVKGDLDHLPEDEPNCRLRVSYEGQVRAEFDRFRECSFRFRGRFRPEQLRVEMLTPEGWVTRKFEDFGDEARLDKVPVTRLYVDNRNNGPVKLVCGAWQVAVEAGGRAVIRLPAAPKGVRRLTINGKEAGPLEGEDVLVDTLGRRSYRHRTLFYGDALHHLGADPFRDPLAQSQEELTFGPGHVHRLPGKIDYFLEMAPATITVTTFRGLPAGLHRRTELREW